MRSATSSGARVVDERARLGVHGDEHRDPCQEVLEGGRQGGEHLLGQELVEVAAGGAELGDERTGLGRVLVLEAGAHEGEERGPAIGPSMSSSTTSGSSGRW